MNIIIFNGAYALLMEFTGSEVQIRSIFPDLSSNKIKNGLRFGKIGSANQPIEPKETVSVKCTKTAIHRKFHALPELQFSDQKLTSFVGIVFWQSLFQTLDVKASLARCFSHLRWPSD